MIPRPCEICGGLEFIGVLRKDDHAISRCAGCSLERIDPQPSDEALGQVYGGHYYRAWGTEQDTEAARLMKRATFAAYFRALRGLPRGSRILDCGAALGFLMEVAGEMGFEPYGVELSADAAERLVRRFGDHRVFVGPFEEAAVGALGEGSFHAVFMCDFLEHVRDPRAALANAGRLLTAGGHLVLSTPDVGSISHWLLRGAWPHYKMEHLYYFNRCNLGRLLDRCGFSVIDAGRAWKRMTLEYVRSQFGVYRHRFLTPAVHLVVGRLPRPLRRWHFPISLGEVLIHARRR